ncbi:uncharacterized protein [Porites lutea]|uniref:uncharacterized protein isoform X2 n=1 Tax=Porites lutea TaxID=51062 RepID=UPI003CC661D6
MSQFSSRGDQIPGIGDGEFPVVPAKPEEESVEGDDKYQLGDGSYQENNYEAPQDDYMEVENEQYTEGGVDEQQSVPEQTTQYAADQDKTHGEQWQWQAENEWGRPAYHQEHAGDAGSSQEADWLSARGRFSRWGEGEPPPGREGRMPVPREGDSEGSGDRRDWRPPLERDEWGRPRPPHPRDERESALGGHERDRRPPFPDERGRGQPFPSDERGMRPPWWDERDGRPPFPRDERGRPPYLRDERERSSFSREGWDERPPFMRDRDLGPPFRDERGTEPPAERIEGESASKDGKEAHEQKESSEKNVAPQHEIKRSPAKERPPFPIDERDRPPVPRDERERPPFPRDERDRPPFPRDERDRPPFPRDERDRPPFPRDEWDRPPFPRDEWHRPPFPRDGRDRPPFPPDDGDFPFPPRDARDRWPPHPRDDRERWPPHPREEVDAWAWEREHGPPGRPLSPRGRSRRGRPPFHEDHRGRPLSPPPWPPFDHPRRGWSPPGRDYRGRSPTREEFDRFGRPPPPRDADFFDDRGRPPPRDWDREDWRRPPDDERFRERHHPDDRWRRSPPPYRDHPEHFPPDRPREWPRDEMRGPDERWYDEQAPTDRRPPHDDYYRDRPPYPEDRPMHDPANYPPHPEEAGHQSEPPRFEKKAEVVPVESILDSPGRESRPDRIVIILRGPPGSGKTHVARLIKDKEVSYGAHAPRILALDDYFLMEVEKTEKDPDTGKKIKKKVTEYVYEEEMEEAYRSSLFKSFTKTLEDGFFPVVIVDAIHDKVEHFEKYWSHAKQKGFEVYVAELMADAHDCAKRNSHNRTFEEINKMVSAWEETPVHHLRLDVRSLLQDAVITEVEMETADETADGDGAGTQAQEQAAQEDQGEPKIQVPSRSKWEDIEPAEDKLNKLDGIRPMKRRREESPPFLPSDDDDPYDEREEDMRIGKKRVRWADLEEKKVLEHRRRIGFCIGTDWSLLTDPNAEIPRM